MNVFYDQQPIKIRNVADAVDAAVGANADVLHSATQHDR